MTDSDFKINDWLVEEKLGKLSRNSDVVHLEPQVMKVLVCLASHAGKVVSKEFLLETLWGSSAVSDAALTRCISEIRQALGDDRKNPTYIQTVPKMGYRVIAEIGQPTAPRKFSRPVFWLTAAAVILIAIAANQPSQPISLAVGQVVVRSAYSGLDSTTLDITANVLGAQIRRGLSELDGHMVVSAASSQTTDPAAHFRDDATTDLENYYLASTVADKDGELEFLFELHNREAEGPVWSENYSSRETNVFEAASSVTRNIAVYFDVELSVSANDRLSESPTSSALAYDSYRKARALYGKYTYVHNQNAIVMYESALRYDEEFGLAYAGLSDALAQQVRYWDGDGLDQARRIAEKAMELEPARTESHKALGETLELSGDKDGALEAYRRALDIDPGNWDSAYHSADIQFDRLNFEQAKALYLQTLQHAPNHGVVMSQLGYMYLKSGNIDQARYWFRRVLEHVPLQAQAASRLAALDLVTGQAGLAISRCEEINQVFPDHRACRQVYAVASLLEGDLSEARKGFNDILDRNPGDGYALLGQAQILIAESQYEQAMRLVDLVLEQSKDNIIEGSDHRYDYWLLAACYTLRDDRANAFAWLDAAASAGHRFFLWDETDPIFTTLHDDERFDQYIVATTMNLE